MNKDNYIKSLESFMQKVAGKVNCLPDYTDPANENNHILRAIDQLQNTSSNSEYKSPSAQSCQTCLHRDDKIRECDICTKYNSFYEKA